MPSYFLFLRTNTRKKKTFKWLQLTKWLGKGELYKYYCVHDFPLQWQMSEKNVLEMERSVSVHSSRPLLTWGFRVCGKVGHHDWRRQQREYVQFMVAKNKESKSKALETQLTFHRFISQHQPAFIRSYKKTTFYIKVVDFFLSWK